MWGFNFEFTTSNYGLTTTPLKEYEISTGMRPCPEEDKKDKKGRLVRVIPRIEELKQLKMCRKACLSDDEILAVVRALSMSTIRITFRHPNLKAQCTDTMLAGAVFRTDVSGVQHDPPSVSDARF